MDMREVTGRLLRVWAGWTVALGLGVLIGGSVVGFGTPLFLLIVAGAGLMDLSIVGRCCRAWLDIAEFRWFWWL